MLPTLSQLTRLLHDAVGVLESTGHDTAGLEDRLIGLPPSYDALLAFAEELPKVPLRDDWPYVEPFAWDEVAAECDPRRSTTPMAPVDHDDASAQIRSGFLGSVVGCQLGKQLEIHPTLDEIRNALNSVGQWPLDDYVTEEALTALGRRNGAGPIRGERGPAHADDDQNYTVLGMLNLERHGRGFTHAQLRKLWEENLPFRMTWGPERRGMAAGAVAAACMPDDSLHPLHDVLVFGDLWCGAQIRADAYGYACPGDPQSAAELAYRDATLNHLGTGAYATAWTAAAFAAAFVVDDPLEMFRVAQRYIPQRSRFAEAMQAALPMVERATDWLDGYDAIHRRFADFGHCKVLQESATMMNTLRFAESVGHGVCLQVMQGNDTDSYGATAGGLLGVFFGPGHLEPRWLEPFGGRVHISLAQFYETELSALADRMAALPSVGSG